MEHALASGDVHPVLIQIAGARIDALSFTTPMISNDVLPFPVMR